MKHSKHFQKTRYHPQTTIISSTTTTTTVKPYPNKYHIYTQKISKLNSIYPLYQSYTKFAKLINITKKYKISNKIFRFSRPCPPINQSSLPPSEIIKMLIVYPDITWNESKFPLSSTIWTKNQTINQIYLSINHQQQQTRTNNQQNFSSPPPTLSFNNNKITTTTARCKYRKIHKIYATENYQRKKKHFFSFISPWSPSQLKLTFAI